MHTKTTITALRFFIISTILLTIPQILYADKLKDKSTQLNINITEPTKSSDMILSHDTKTIEETIDEIKLETALFILGSEFISVLSNNGFSVDEDTTMKELFSIPDPNYFIHNWITDNPQTLKKLCNIISRKRNKTKPPATLSFMCRLMNPIKIILSFAVLATRLPTLVAQEATNIAKSKLTPPQIMRACHHYAYNMTKNIAAALNPKFIPECCKQWMITISTSRNYYISPEQIKTVSNKVCSEEQPLTIPLAASGISVAIIIAISVSIFYCSYHYKACFSKKNQYTPPIIII